MLYVEVPPASDFPSDIQYVMREGNTVVTLEMLGGEQVTVASTLPLAQPALSLVQSTCGADLHNT